jgi:hypothetical protein
MQNKPLQSLQLKAQVKGEFDNFKITNITSCPRETSTQRISNNGKEVVNDESLNIRDNYFADNFLSKANKTSILGTNVESTDVVEVKGEQETSANRSDILRLFIKNGEFVYAHPQDIIMIESCDHLVKVHIVSGDKVKKTIRNNTLKDFLTYLPSDQFMRIGRFCAINLHRLSGGSFNDQTFEFDFKISIKLQHSISNSAFNSIGK